jgi:hypothetical protein
LDYILDAIDKSFGVFQGKAMLELGDQVIRDPNIPETTGKDFFSNKGLSHTSVDLNGRHGSVRLDLSKPAKKPDWVKNYDIITNAGTSEHVEPLKGQYECFKNIHNWLKPGGVQIHLLPDIGELEAKGAWKNHCNNYYSHRFFSMLAANNGYEIISEKIINGLICVCLRKDRDTPFMKKRRLFLRHIDRKKGGWIYKGINDGPQPSVFSTLYKYTKKAYRSLRATAKKLVKSVSIHT